MTTAAAVSEEDVRAFVYREAWLIDQKELDAWYDLFTEDALYWMPLARGQEEGDIHTSLFYEDKFLLKVRIERLKNPRAASQQPPSFCQHVLQRPDVERIEPANNNLNVRTPFIYVESQLDSQFTLAGVAHHELSVVDGALRIRRKRIELLTRDAALPSIQLFL